MNVMVSIFGTSKSKAPDMRANFVVTESMTNGRWTNGVKNFEYTLDNELIDEIDESRLVDRIKEKIYSLINSPVARQWVSSPTLRVYYNPEAAGNVIVKSVFD